MSTTFFTSEEKGKYFDLISQRFYDRNFGTMTKTDFEILLFHIYLDHLVESNLSFDDYTISKALGITQNKVRTLKVRKELQYPRERDNWRKCFADSIKNASYDESSKMVKLLVPEVTVMTELRYFMETNGWYDEYQLNPRLFQCKLDFFIKLCSKLSNQGIQLTIEAEESLKALETQADSPKEKSAIRKILEGSVEDGVKSIIETASKELLLQVLGALPFGGVAATAIRFLIDVITRSQ